MCFAEFTHLAGRTCFCSASFVIRFSKLFSRPKPPWRYFSLSSLFLVCFGRFSDAYHRSRGLVTDRQNGFARWGVSGCYLYNKVFGYGAHRSTSVTLFDHLPATKNVVLCRSSARGMPGRNVFYRLRGTAMVSRCVCSDPRRLSSFLFFDATATRNFE